MAEKENEWVIVPRLPTTEMRMAGSNANVIRSIDFADEVYARMLAAAPQSDMVAVPRYLLKWINRNLPDSEWAERQQVRVLLAGEGVTP